MEEFKHYYTHFLANLGVTDSITGRAFNGLVSVASLGFIAALLFSSVLSALLFILIYLSINFAVVGYIDPVEKDFTVPKWKEVFYYTGCEFLFVYHFLTGQLKSKLALAKETVAKEKVETQIN